MAASTAYALPDKHGLKAPFAALHHVGLVTSDMEATVTFYREILGSEVALAHRQGDANVRHYMITVAPNTVFAFFEFPDAELPGYAPPTLPKTGRALDHISFYLESMEQLEGWKQHLDEHGIEYSGMEVPNMVEAIFFPDPNNIVIELMVEIGAGLDLPIHDDPQPAF